MLVKRVQVQLRTTGWEVVADGDFGNETDRVVRSFQRRKGLLDDGVVGRKTWSSMF
jgi:peptidoglycan hydrolase-like protein with peptidoglycan-binding domain